MLEATRLRMVAAALGVLVLIGCGRIPPSEVAGGAPTTTAVPAAPSATASNPTATATPIPTPIPTPTPTPSPTAAGTPTSSTSPSPRATTGVPRQSPSVTPTSSEAPSESPQARRSVRPSQSPTSPRREREQPSESPRRGDSSGRRVVYLTFDDGPSSYTPRILDILARYSAKATFFIIGQNAADNPSGVRAMARAGMSVQNHSWAHTDLTTLADREIRSDINRTDEAIRTAGGGSSDCVRPPYGATNSRVRAVLGDLGKRQQLWTIDTRDWTRPGANRLYRRTVDAVESGSIVLLHDGGGVRTQTVAALPRILATLRERGFRFGTLC